MKIVVNLMVVYCCYLLHGTYLDVTSDVKFKAYLAFLMFKDFFSLLLVSAVGGLRR